MSLLAELLERPPRLPGPSRYAIGNGIFYLGTGLLLIIWPQSVQTFFLEPPFVGHEGGLFRVVGLTLAVIGWFYVIGGRSGSRQFVAATVVDRLLVPVVLVPLALAGVYPHISLTFAILDPALAIGAWALLRAPVAALAKSQAIGTDLATGS